MPTSKRPSDKDSTAKDKHVWIVILCGLPGSGKSTLRRQMVALGWHYVSQDESGSMEECGKNLLQSLKSGHSCIIDRCNVTTSERRMCMQLGTRAVDKGDVKGTIMHFEAVWMATPPDVCKARAAAQVGHETLSPERAADVVDQFCNGLRIPQRTGQEPYDAVLSVSSAQDAATVLQRYANPACVQADALTALPSETSRLSPGVPTFADADLDALLPAELFVVRHGERADRAKQRDDGWPDDSLLTKEGQETAKRAGCGLRALAGSRVVAVYSSPFCRCLQTADQIAAELSIPVRVEPGLSELSSVFEESPRLRSSSESLSRALKRSDVDLSLPPVKNRLPQWPEKTRDSNQRVLSVAKSLRSRHAGESIVLVCHAHSLIEITRHLSTEGGGLAGSCAGYCAMSHISQSGVLQRCLDLTYLGAATEHASGHHHDQIFVNPSTGSWSEHWSWIAPDSLLSMKLENVLAEHPKFRDAFERGSEAQRKHWLEGWQSPDDAMRKRLRLACEKGLFCT